MGGGFMLTRCSFAAVISLCGVVMHIERAYEFVVVTDSVNVLLFVHVPAMMCMMCPTWFIFVVALKVKKAPSAQNRGGLPTKDMNV